jgi:hypothetical protein
VLDPVGAECDIVDLAYDLVGAFEARARRELDDGGEITDVRGTIFGYWEKGRKTIVARPATAMKMLSTAANRG